MSVIDGTKPTIIYALPCYEPATCMWSNAAKVIIPRELADKPINYVILYGSASTPEVIHDAMKKPDVKMLKGVGHGAPPRFTTTDNRTVYSTEDPQGLEELRGKNFSPVSCLVGLELLPTMEKHGLGAGLGETKEYIITSGAINSFVYSELSYDLWLIRGATHKEAYEAMLRKYEAEARQRELMGDVYAARLLRYDAKYRAKFGHDDWKLIETPTPPQPPQPPTPPSGRVKVTITIPETTLEGWITWEQQ